MKYIIGRLLALRGRRDRAEEGPLSGSERTSQIAAAMSASDPIRKWGVQRGGLGIARSLGTLLGKAFGAIAH